MTKIFFDQSTKTGLAEETATYADIKGEGYDLGAVDVATVAEKHRGTAIDQHDMQVLGRVQELRVRNFSSSLWQLANLGWRAAQLWFLVHHGIRVYAHLHLGVYSCVRCSGRGHPNLCLTPAALTPTAVPSRAPSPMEALPVFFGDTSLW